MATLPSIAALTGDTVTQAQFKTALGNLRTFLFDLLGDAGTEAAALSAIGALLNAVSAKTSAYTVVADDRGVLIDATSGTWTLSLTAAATLGAGFAFAVRNSGTGTITIDPNGTEQIDGSTTVTLPAGASCLVVCTGSAWRTVARTGANVVDQQIFNTSGTWTWTKPTSGSMVLIECWGGGGGGGATYQNSPASGWGGGGGEYVRRIMRLSDVGASETVTVGAGGAGRTGSNGPGTAGGNSSFGAHLTAYGGQGGDGETAQYSTSDAMQLVRSGYLRRVDDTFGTYTASEARSMNFSYEGAGGCVFFGNDYSGARARNAIWGGGAGGNGRNGGAWLGGTSVYGGAGGAGAQNGVSQAVAGTQPGGGGGGGWGTSGGGYAPGANGGAGRVRVTVW